MGGARLLGERPSASRLGVKGMEVFRKPLTWWQATLILLIAIVVIGAIVMWRMRPATYLKPEGTPETYEQMQKAPAARP
jgi:hypothetical protein